MGEKVLMQDIIDLLAEERKITKREAETFIKAIFDIIEEALKNDQYIKIKGLGCFKLIDINSRESIHINTGERILIEEHTKISFTPDPSLRDLINKPFAHFETVILNDDTNLDDTPTEEEEPDVESDAVNEITNENEVTSNVAETTCPTTVTEKLITTEEQPSDKIEEATGKQIKTEADVISAGIPENENIKPQKMNQEEKQGLPYFIAVVAIIIVTLSGTIIYIYNPKLLLDLLPEAKQTTNITIDSIQNPKSETALVPVQLQDSLKDTLSTANGVKEMPFDKVLREVREENTGKKTINTQATYSDTLEYLIVGTKATYTLKPGETLIMVSKRFYGTKELWPYIARYNQDIIRNPDKVSFGTTVKVPELKRK